jgi:hypothetical protein
VLQENTIEIQRAPVVIMVEHNTNHRRKHYLVSSKQATEFEATKAFQINHVKKTFSFVNDICTALETYKEFDINVHKPTFCAVLNLKQKDGESLQDYTKTIQNFS